MSRALLLAPSATVKRTATGRFSFTLRATPARELKQLLEHMLSLERTEQIWHQAGVIEAMYAALAAEMWHKLHGLALISARTSFSLSPLQAVVFCSLLQDYVQFLPELRGQLQQKLT